MKYILVALGLTLGNFTYQMLLKHPDFGLAFERSYFQIIAIAAAYFLVAK